MDVLVIGAGAAGLAAAVRLREAGKRPIVVEARDRIGGRILTRDDAELGAEFVHGEAPDTRALARRAGISIAGMPGKTAVVREDGRLDRDPEEFGRVVGSLSHAGSSDRSYLDFERQRTDWSEADRKVARAFIEGFHAADADRVSLEALSGLGADSQRLEAPQDRLVQFLASSLDPSDLLLGRRVTRVRFRPGDVAVHTLSPLEHPMPPLRARAAVVTVPLGVMRAPPHLGIGFDPEVPGHREAARRLEMGAVVKAVLRFRHPPMQRFERLRGLSFLIAPGAAAPTLWTPARGAGLLVAWRGGPRAWALPARELVQGAIAVLARSAGEDPESIESDLIGWDFHDWQGDPFSRGAYSWEPAGGGGAREALGRPVAGTLFFAGEATCVGGNEATVDGALASGDRAAQQVLDALG